MNSWGGGWVKATWESAPLAELGRGISLKLKQGRRVEKSREQPHSSVGWGRAQGHGKKRGYTAKAKAGCAQKGFLMERKVTGTTANEGGRGLKKNPGRVRTGS